MATMSRGGHSIVTRRSANIEQIPLFYPRGGAAPLQGIPPIATLERFVVYCPSELIISGRAPGRGPEGTGNCSSCSITCSRGASVCPDVIALWRVHTGDTSSALLTRPPLPGCEDAVPPFVALPRRAALLKFSAAPATLPAWAIRRRGPEALERDAGRRFWLTANYNAKP